MVGNPMKRFLVFAKFTQKRGRRNTALGGVLSGYDLSGLRDDEATGLDSEYEYDSF